MLVVDHAPLGQQAPHWPAAVAVRGRSPDGQVAASVVDALEPEVAQPIVKKLVVMESPPTTAVAVGVIDVGQAEAARIEAK